MLVIAIIALALFWLIVIGQELRRSLRWWQTQQIRKLAQEAEVIRDGLLQDSFVVRRNLELLFSTGAKSVAGNDERCLMALDQLHTSLKELGDRLSPPYLEASFPLAVQSLLDEWRSRVPALLINVDCPQNWDAEVGECEQFILMVLDELLRLLLDDASQKAPIDRIQVWLQAPSSLHKLIIQFEYFDGSALKSSIGNANWRYLKRIFWLTTTGNCWYRQDDATLTWYFQW